MTPQTRIAAAVRILEEATAILQQAVDGGMPTQEPMLTICQEVVLASGEQIRMACDRIKVCSRTNGDATEVYAAAVAVKESILARLSLVQTMHQALLNVRFIDKSTENG